MIKESAMFEQDVRKIARELFPGAGGYSAVIVDGRERDGVIDDGETIHIIEATCDPTKKKAENDLQKSVELKKLLQRTYQDRNFKLWFITLKDPTADQSQVVQDFKRLAKCPVIGMSLAAFSQRLVDAPSYIIAREHYPFGSVRNLDPTGSSNLVPENDFIPLDMVDLTDSQTVNPATLAKEISSNAGIYIISGDFGAGKSMTARHIFRRLSDKVISESAIIFPMFLNLRDHIGQDDPASAIYAHGQRVGYTNPERLVRAWRAGFVHMFLDGFDEISSSRFRADSKGLRLVRFRAMTLVRNFIDTHPRCKAGLIVTGRQNYFGSDAELGQALGLSQKSVKMLSLTEFTTEQVQSYIQRMGHNQEVVPDWLPSRPLLLGYLAVKGAFNPGGRILTEMSRAAGWDYLLDRICEREGRQIEELGGDSRQVRGYIERLATRARASTSGRGPIPASELADIFRQVFPSTPDEAAQQLLLRMAGLTAVSGSAETVIPSAPDQEDAREFIDNDFVNAARAGDVIRFIENPFDEDLGKLFSDINCIWRLDELGIEVATKNASGFADGKLRIGLRRSATDVSAPVLAIDLLEIIRRRGSPPIAQSDRDELITIKGAYLEDFEFLAGIDLTGIVLKDFIFDQISIDRQAGSVLGPKMTDSMVGRAYGVVSRSDIPMSIIDGSTTIETFEMDVDATKEIWKQLLPAGLRVLLASLRKLFVQAGRARKENAFPRGLDDNERPYVQDVLSLIQKYGFAYPQRSGGPPLWIPNRTMTKDAITILHAPQESSHPILREARNL